MSTREARRARRHLQRAYELLNQGRPGFGVGTGGDDHERIGPDRHVSANERTSPYSPKRYDASRTNAECKTPINIHIQVINKDILDKLEKITKQGNLLMEHHINVDAVSKLMGAMPYLTWLSSNVDENQAMIQSLFDQTHEKSVDRLVMLLQIVTVVHPNTENWKLLKTVNDIIYKLTGTLTANLFDSEPQIVKPSNQMFGPLIQIYFNEIEMLLDYFDGTIYPGIKDKVTALPIEWLFEQGEGSHLKHNFYNLPAEYKHTFIVYDEKNFHEHISVLHVRTRRTSDKTDKINVDVYCLDAANEFRVSSTIYIHAIREASSSTIKTHSFRVIMCEPRQTQYDHASCGVFALEDSIRCFLHDSCIEGINIGPPQVFIDPNDKLVRCFATFTKGNPLTAYSQFVNRHSIIELFDPEIKSFIVPIQGTSKSKNILIHVITNLYKIILVRECYKNKKYCPPSSESAMIDFKSRKRERDSANLGT